jgi:hypothetical protein
MTTPKQGATAISSPFQMQGFIALEEEREEIRPGDLVDFIPVAPLAG